MLQGLIDILEIDLAPYDRCLLDPDDPKWVLREDGTPLDAQEREAFDQAVAAYEKAMLKAIRLGLEGVPPIANWIVTWRGLGARGLLRRAKCGLERGVRRPLRAPHTPPHKNRNTHLRPDDVIAAYQQLQGQRINGQPFSFLTIHHNLAKAGMIPNRHGTPMRRQALDKLLRTWGIR